MKLLMLILILSVLVCLAFALFYMLKKKEESQEPSKRMAKALAWRIGISVILFLSILIFWKLGWIKPTGIPLQAV